VICDLGRRQIIDLLRDREPATIEAWLRRHPEPAPAGQHKRREVEASALVRVLHGASGRDKPVANP